MSAYDPARIANHLRDAANEFDRSHPELKDDWRVLRGAVVDAIGFLEAFAELAKRAELERAAPGEHLGPGAATGGRHLSTELDKSRPW